MRRLHACWRIPCFIVGIIVYAIFLSVIVPSLAIVGLFLTVIPLVGEGMLFAAWDTFVDAPNQVREGWRWCIA